MRQLRIRNRIREEENGPARRSKPSTVGMNSLSRKASMHFSRTIFPNRSPPFSRPESTQPSDRSETVCTARSNHFTDERRELSRSHVL